MITTAVSELTNTG